MAELDYDEVRGVATNKGLINENEGWRIGNLERLGLTLKKLEGKKILDVAIGGGNSIKEGVQLGLDIYGVDIIPALSLENKNEDEKLMIERRQRQLRSLASTTENRILAVDAGEALPFPDDYFDVSMSGHGLPGYARNPTEAVTSILEMIRVTKEEVVFNANWDEKGLAELGSGKFEFSFPMLRFVEELMEYGITSFTTRPEENGLKGPQAVHLDLANKDGQALKRSVATINTMFR